MPDFVGAIDQGTTSTRFLVFDHGGTVVSQAQLEHRQVMPRPGWLEHDAAEIWRNTVHVIEAALGRAGLTGRDLAAVGVTNQRETTVVWDPRSGRPLAPAIVWQDTRTADLVAAMSPDQRALVQQRTGLPPAAYFAGTKLQWLLAQVPGLREAAEAGDAVFGTVDSWLTWNLTGGVDGGLHVTDVTNASRTMFMDLERLTWDDELLAHFGVPARMLPTIRPSSVPGGYAPTAAEGPFGGPVPVAAMLGDQHAAVVGHLCLRSGEAKNTYGTGSFLLLNTGTELVRSANGLLSTVAYQLGEEPAVYALEGSIAVTGSAVQWLRDQLGVIREAAEVETLARAVDDNGGVHFVPAFSGLYAPRWRPDARGVVVGLTRHSSKEHLARATLEAIAHQTCDVVAAMERDSGVALEVLKVDGGVTANDLCMQIQADVLGVPVVRSAVTETTALGAAYAAGLAVGFWASFDELRGSAGAGTRWEPQWSAEQRRSARDGWERAVERTLEWETA